MSYLVGQKTTAGTSVLMKFGYSQHRTPHTFKYSTNYMLWSHRPEQQLRWDGTQRTRYPHSATAAVYQRVKKEESPRSGRGHVTGLPTICTRGDKTTRIKDRMCCYHMLSSSCWLCYHRGFCRMKEQRAASDQQSHIFCNSLCLMLKWWWGKRKVEVFCYSKELVLIRRKMGEDIHCSVSRTHPDDLTS